MSDNSKFWGVEEGDFAKELKNALVDFAQKGIDEGQVEIQKRLDSTQFKLKLDKLHFEATNKNNSKELQKLFQNYINDIINISKSVINKNQDELSSSLQNSWDTLFNASIAGRQTSQMGKDFAANFVAAVAKGISPSKEMSMAFNQLFHSRSGETSGYVQNITDQIVSDLKNGANKIDKELSANLKLINEIRNKGAEALLTSALGKTNTKGYDLSDWLGLNIDSLLKIADESFNNAGDSTTAYTKFFKAISIAIKKGATNINKDWMDFYNGTKADQLKVSRSLKDFMNELNSTDVPKELSLQDKFAGIIDIVKELRSTLSKKDNVNFSQMFNSEQLQNVIKFLQNLSDEELVKLGLATEDDKNSIIKFRNAIDGSIIKISELSTAMEYLEGRNEKNTDDWNEVNNCIKPFIQNILNLVDAEKQLSQDNPFEGTSETTEKINDNFEETKKKLTELITKAQDFLETTLSVEQGFDVESELKAAQEMIDKMAEDIKNMTSLEDLFSISHLKYNGGWMDKLANGFVFDKHSSDADSFSLLQTAGLDSIEYNYKGIAQFVAFILDIEKERYKYAQEENTNLEYQLGTAKKLKEVYSMFQEWDELNYIIEDPDGNGTVATEAQIKRAQELNEQVKEFLAKYKEIHVLMKNGKESYSVNPFTDIDELTTDARKIKRVEFIPVDDTTEAILATDNLYSSLKNLCLEIVEFYNTLKDSKAFNDYIDGMQRFGAIIHRDEEDISEATSKYGSLSKVYKKQSADTDETTKANKTNIASIDEMYQAYLRLKEIINSEDEALKKEKDELLVLYPSLEKIVNLKVTRSKDWFLEQYAEEFGTVQEQCDNLYNSINKLRNSDNIARKVTEKSDEYLNDLFNGTFTKMTLPAIGYDIPVDDYTKALTTLRSALDSVSDEANKAQEEIDKLNNVISLLNFNGSTDKKAITKKITELISSGNSDSAAVLYQYYLKQLKGTTAASKFGEDFANNFESYLKNGLQKIKEAAQTLNSEDFINKKAILTTFYSITNAIDKMQKHVDSIPARIEETIKVIEKVYPAIEKARKETASLKEETNADAIWTKMLQYVAQYIEKEKELSTILDKRDAIFDNFDEEKYGDLSKVISDYDSKTEPIIDEIKYLKSVIFEVYAMYKKLNGTEDFSFTDRNSPLSNLKEMISELRINPSFINSLEYLVKLVNLLNKTMLSDWNRPMDAMKAFLGITDQTSSSMEKLFEEQSNGQMKLAEVAGEVSAKEEKAETVQEEYNTAIAKGQMTLDEYSTSLQKAEQQTEKISKKSADSIDKENKAFDQTEKSSTKVANGKKKYSDANKKAKKDTDEFIPSIEKENSSFDETASSAKNAGTGLDNLAEKQDEIKQKAKEAGEELLKQRKAISQIGSFELDENLEGGFSFVEPMGQNQTRTVFTQWNQDTLRWETTLGDAYTNFQALENEILRANKQLGSMQLTLQKNKDLYGSQYDTTSVDKLIQLQKDYIDNLKKSLRTYAESDGYMYQMVQYQELLSKLSAQDAENNIRIANAQATRTAQQNKNYKKQLENMQVTLARMFVNPKHKYIDSFEVKITDWQNRVADKLNNDSFSNESTTDLDKFIADYKEFVSVETKARDVLNQSYDTIAKYQVKLAKDMNNNSAMSSELKAKFEALYEEGNRMASTRFFSDKEFSDWINACVKAEAEMYKTGQTGKSMFAQLISSLKTANAQFLSMYFSWQDWLRYIKETLTYVEELDSALTELRVVSGATSDELKGIADISFILAQNLASTTTEVVESITSWRRLGYSIEEATTLAEQASKLSIGGLMDTDTATEALTSALQAFDEFNVDNLSDAVDQLIYIGNNYAITTEDLATSMEKSSAALVAANNNFAQVAALEVSGNTILQDADTVANSIKVLSMRLRGTTASALEEAGEDTEGLIEDASKLYTTIKKLTSVNGDEGVSIINTDTGEYKSTYEILLEISKVYDKLSDANQAALLETIAGRILPEYIEICIKEHI